MSSLSKLLDVLKSKNAIVLGDLNPGINEAVIQADLNATALSIPHSAVQLWTTINGTRLPEGSKPGYAEERRLDGKYKFISAAEAALQYGFQAEERAIGAEAVENLPASHLPIAVGIFAEWLTIECDESSSDYGAVSHYDFPAGELRKKSNSLDRYFETIASLLHEEIITIDSENELDIPDFDKYFKHAGMMNPGCDYWIS